LGMKKIILIIINVLGGVAVLGSYYVIVNAQAAGATALWGGISENVRPVYTVSMFLSALGYFAFLSFLLFRLSSDETVFGRFGYRMFYWIFLAMLLPSALWMPLSSWYLDNPSVGLWILIVVVLALVGLASISLVWALLSLKTRTRGAGVWYWFAVVGASYFAFHTAVLDAIIWPVLFQ